MDGSILHLPAFPDFEADRRIAVQNRDSAIPFYFCYAPVLAGIIVIFRR
jgi:hypothetical protein